jgi:hypothetical protein
MTSQGTSEVASASGPVPFAGGWERNKDRYCIWIVTPQNYTHSHAFDEVALSLQGAFEELGGSAPIVRDIAKFGGRVPIIFGGNLLPRQAITVLPADSVVVNLEQVSDDSTWLKRDYMDILRAFPVVDYSARNRDNLAAKGITHAQVLGIGYSPVLSCIPQAPVKDIDVLFYGSTNDRRMVILNALHQRGVRVVPLFNVYGSERDAAIARAKIVINIHHYSSNIFEIVRVSYLLANGACVVTEGNPRDPDVAPFLNGLAVTPYEDLVPRCLALLADEGARLRMADAGLSAIKALPQSKMLMDLVRANAPA